MHFFSSRAEVKEDKDGLHGEEGVAKGDLGFGRCWMALARKGDLTKSTRLQLNVDRFGKGNYLAENNLVWQGTVADSFGWVEIESASRKYQEIWEGGATCRLHRKSPWGIIKKIKAQIASGSKSHLLVPGQWVNSVETVFGVLFCVGDMLPFCLGSLCMLPSFVRRFT